ncbi:MULTISPECIES: toll/interleukin-1 receptor domain-containing protein [Vibrio]|uniref:toll/interleukin-1 receptor domain-containing protein n=1 Tax=Vibrio TaxID=662 RepID=UPI000C2AEF00|nr:MULTISPECIES: toll/interleukin-1 receptor domain-containing protein [Vibrio]MCA3958202.1 toll/interleukin-1 receptor domain-containing protein [Vibrio vulnificus]HAS6087927.1 TIR domain-containing protein [Vibrio vulnificus]
MKKPLFKEIYRISGLVIPVTAGLLSLMFLLSESGNFEVLKFAVGFSGAFIGGVVVYLYAKIRTAFKKPKVFISYSPQDEAVVKEICQALNDINVDILIDKHELMVGDDIDKKISSLVEESDYIIYVHSSSSATSEWSRKELRKAFNLNKKILPVVVDNEPLSKFIENLLYADYRYNPEEAMNQLRKVFAHIKHNKAFKSDS